MIFWGARVVPWHSNTRLSPCTHSLCFCPWPLVPALPRMCSKVSEATSQHSSQQSGNTKVYKTKKILGTPAGCRGDTRRDEQGSNGRHKRTKENQKSKTNPNQLFSCCTFAPPPIGRANFCKGKHLLGSDVCVWHLGPKNPRPLCSVCQQAPQKRAPKRRKSTVKKPASPSWGASGPKKSEKSLPNEKSLKLRPHRPATE